MADDGSAIGSPLNKIVDDGQEEEFQDALDAADSDRDSDMLSEIDENQFEDYDPETANIEDRPVHIDDDIARTLKVSKRKRTDDAPRRPREGRREKKRRDRAEDAGVEDGSDAGDGGKKRRSRRAATDGERRPRAKAATPEPENEHHLDPEERRRRAIERSLDAAIQKPTGPKRRRKDEIVRRMQNA